MRKIVKSHSGLHSFSHRDACTSAHTHAHTIRYTHPIDKSIALNDSGILRDRSANNNLDFILSTVYAVHS